MGCDGGTIPTRDELVRLKKKPEQKDKDGHRLFKWQHCALSQQPLRKPVMACEMGKLYNKESVIELLLNKERNDTLTTHIEKLKDVIELELTPNPSYSKKNAVGDGMYNDALISPWICPVTGLEMNGRFKFVFSFSNGKVAAERALKVLRSDPAEAIYFKEEDLITINPEEEELDLMNTKMIARRARVKAAKKASKEAKKKKLTDAAPDQSASASASSDGFKVPLTNGTSSSDTNGEPPAKKSAKMANGFGDQQPRGKKTNDPSKIKGSGGLSNSSSSSSDVSKIAAKSVQNDPNASEVYKRLFSSHKSAQNLPKGNWVTFDPRYN